MSFQVNYINQLPKKKVSSHTKWYANPGPTCTYYVHRKSRWPATCPVSPNIGPGFNDASTKGPYPRLFSKLRIKSASPWPFFCVVMWLVENHLPRAPWGHRKNWATQILHQLMLVEGLIRTSHMVQDFERSTVSKNLVNSRTNKQTPCRMRLDTQVRQWYESRFMSRTMFWLSVSQLVPLLMKEETIDYILRGPPPSMAFFSSGRFQCFPLFSEQISFPTSSLQQVSVKDASCSWSTMGAPATLLEKIVKWTLLCVFSFSSDTTLFKAIKNKEHRICNCVYVRVTDLEKSNIYIYICVYIYIHEAWWIFIVKVVCFG